VEHLKDRKDPKKPKETSEHFTESKSQRDDHNEELTRQREREFESIQRKTKVDFIATFVYRNMYEMW
jgi:hypothetical protein